jgi:acyl carrier protein phosphodiesterase
MRDEEWLVGYRDPHGISMALRGLSHRIARHPPLAMAVRHLTDSRNELRTRFDEFFPDVVAFAAGIRSAT